MPNFTFQYIENWPITFLASFLIWVMFAALIALWIVDGKIQKKQVVSAVLATAIAFVISQLVKEILPTLRPFILFGLQARTLTLHQDGAFPSSHTAVAFGLASSVWRHHRKAGLAFIFSALLVGLGRVLSNVHFVWDIIGGAFIGVAVVLLIERFKIIDFIVK